MKYMWKICKPTLIAPAFSADMWRAIKTFSVLLIEIKKSGANTSSTSGSATAVQGKGMQLFLLPQALAVLQGQQVVFYVAHFIALFSVQ